MVIYCDPLFQMIYSYTRKQALKDGNFIDVTEQAKKAGFDRQDLHNPTCQHSCTVL